MTRLEDTIFAYILSEEEHKGALLLTAKTPTGNIPLKIWRADRNPPPKTGDYLLLRARDLQAAEEELEKWKSISLDSKYDKQPNYTHQTVPEEEIPPEVRSVINRDRKPQIAAALRLLNDPGPWNDKGLHGLVRGFVEENGKRFLNAPAATSNHHTWRGGLLVHTAEVAANCHALLQSPMNQFYRDRIDSDVLLLAAWFHDSGKMDTYRMDGERPAIDGEMEGMFGHIVLGDRIFREAANRAGVDPKTMEKASHCILSHHEKKEWGSPVTPKTTEAEILCRADYISSRMPD